MQASSFATPQLDSYARHASFAFARLKFTSTLRLALFSPSTALLATSSGRLALSTAPSATFTARPLVSSEPTS